MAAMLECQKSDLINTNLENLVGKKLLIAEVSIGSYQRINLLLLKVAQ